MILMIVLMIIMMIAGPARVASGAFPPVILVGILAGMTLQKDAPERCRDLTAPRCTPWMTSVLRYECCCTPQWVLSNAWVASVFPC